MLQLAHLEEELPQLGDVCAGPCHASVSSVLTSAGGEPRVQPAGWWQQEVVLLFNNTLLQVIPAK
jgi:hypothetical protein